MAEWKRSVEDVVVNSFWNNKRVLVTGHTGFKGAWLATWLRELNAEVVGIGLQETPCLFDELSLDGVTSHLLDIRNASQVRECIVDFSPEVLFHLAAQPLVRRSYDDPMATWYTNVIGTINVLESLRHLEHPVVGVLIATDKVYHNNEWQYGYREVDPLGGLDPYSSSKAAMEIAVNSWRHSFFKNKDVAVATTRAGNVLGGGDYAEDRIFPDIVRALKAGSSIGVRSPEATRPWQHVLEPLAGYLELAKRIFESQANEGLKSLDSLCTAWNFGPLPESNRSVRDVVEASLRHWPGTWEDKSESNAPHEAKFLALAIEKATRSLSWYPRWDFESTIEKCVEWYRRVHNGESAREVTVEQIKQYECYLTS